MSAAGKSFEDATQLQLVLWSGLLHHCRETMVCDGSGRVEVYRRRDWATSSQAWVTRCGFRVA